MFKNLKNEAKITFNLKLDSPLSIRSGNENGIDPTLPDMQCVRTYRDGKNTVFIPGSSIKGVMRNRCERIIKFLGGDVCNIVDRKDSCGDKNDKNLSGKEVYDKMCFACKMFGSTSLGGRVKFKDAYPIGDVKMGVRNGVGINRITGAAQRGALYDFEVVEDGTFGVAITMTNYELYQLKLLLFTIQDIEDGYVTFGGSTTRGNGKMRIENLKIEFRDYRKGTNTLTGYDEKDKGANLEFEKQMYFYRAQVPKEENLKKENNLLNSMSELLRLLDSIDVESAVRRG